MVDVNKFIIKGGSNVALIFVSLHYVAFKTVSKYSKLSFNLDDSIFLTRRYFGHEILTCENNLKKSVLVMFIRALTTIDLRLLRVKTNIQRPNWFNFVLDVLFIRILRNLINWDK